MNVKNQDFNWGEYDHKFKGGNRLVPNTKINGQDNKKICFSRAPYAQDAFEMYTQGALTAKKDLTKGDCVPVTGIDAIRNSTITLELSGGISVDIDLNREKKFLQLFGYSSGIQFAFDLSSMEFRNKFLTQGISAYVVESFPNVKVSLWQGHLKQVKEEFMREIESPSKAYVAKVIEANRGGYFVEVQGVDAFMPGSLAAPNKILDFKTLVGKEVIVMVESFLPEMNSFIVSHKKYIEHVLPTKINELDMAMRFTGTVTGSSKYGVFLEFDEIFTGLLHESKMKANTLSMFTQRKFAPGDTLEFYIYEVTRDNRIILTEESPEERFKKIQKFVDDNMGNAIDAEVAAVMGFGMIVNVGELSGLIQGKELKRKRISFSVGDKVKVKLSEFKDGKLLFDLHI